MSPMQNAARGFFFAQNSADLPGKKCEKQDRGDAAEHAGYFKRRKFFFEEDDTEGEGSEETHLCDS